MMSPTYLRELNAARLRRKARFNGLRGFVLVAGDQTGSRNAFSKLTEDDVREIRRLRKTEGGPSLAELGRRYGVTAHAIAAAASGRNWRHVPMEVKP